MTPSQRSAAVLSNSPVVRVYSRAKLPTRSGPFEIISFTDTEGKRIEDVAIVVGDVSGVDNVETRVHSECLTGDVFGSVR